MELKLKLPDKIYFKIGEVSKILSLKPHVIRFWESEFPNIKPVKSRTGQRLYRRSDIEMLNLIKDLLYNQKYTIKGAKKYLRAKGIVKSLKEKQKRDSANPQLILSAVKDRINNLINIIERAESKLIK